MSFSVSSKDRLTHHDVGRFPGNTLFDRLARAVCEAGCLPRKELYESWEMARRVRRRLRGGRVVDLAAGHGLLSHVLLLLDDSSPEAMLVDTAPPPSAARLHAVLVEAWPRLAGRIVTECRPLASVQLSADDLGRVEPCLRRADRHRPRSRGVGPRTGRRPALLPRPRRARRRLVVGLDGPVARHRRDACGSARASGDTRSGRRRFQPPSRRRTGCSSGNRWTRQIDDERSPSVSRMSFNGCDNVRASRRPSRACL